MKKFGQYLPVAFAVLALVMLLFTAAAGKDAPAWSEPLATDPAVQTTGPAGEETEPGPGETLPRDALTRVEEALDRYDLDETAMALCIYDGMLHADDNTSGAGRRANAHALANLCDERRMNPIAAFWLLTDQELYEYAGTWEETIGVPAFTLPLQVRKQYPYTAEGTRELLTDILTLAAAAEDGLNMENRVLGGNGMVEEEQVFREAGECYYAYFIYYGERSAHFLCFYARGEEQIDDLEFQMMNLRYASGDEEALNRIDQLGDRQAASLMAAAEQLLTGSSKADEGRIPLSYSVDGSRAAIERFAITGDGETGTLTNYDLHLAP